MAVVTYKGPKDPADQSTEVIVDGVSLPLGRPVSVPAKVAELVKNVDGHSFVFKSEKTAKPKAEKTPEKTDEEAKS